MFVGLLRADGTEPSTAAGYRRVLADLPPNYQFGDIQVHFAEVREPGYGEIDRVAVFAEASGGAPVRTFRLPKPIDTHAGVIPLVAHSDLWRGVDISARITGGSGAACSAGR